jgi:hypothetical protein
MKRIVIKKVKDTLKEIGIDDLQIDIITNTIDLYNDVIKDYKDNKKNGYMLYQLSIQVNKMIEGIFKYKQVDTQENDNLTSMLNELKKNRIETR